MTDSHSSAPTDIVGTPESPHVEWTTLEQQKYGREPFCASHNIHEHPAFSEQGLIDLLDRYPRERLQVFTMGDDPENRFEWEPVDTRDASGADIMHAVAVGKLWVKLMRLDLADQAVADLVDELYADLQRQDPGFHALWVRPLLLISSPGALVYYHTDPQNMMLWQISGTKRVWIYPPKEPFILPEMMEEIFAGDADEEVPYQLDFDESANVFDLKPGEVLSWPLNAPHRVTNHDSVNVSMSVTVGSESADRRSELYQANLMLRRKLGMRNPSASDTGAVSFIKRTGFRVARKLGMTPGMASQREPYMATSRIDGSSPAGIQAIPDGPVKTLF